MKPAEFTSRGSSNAALASRPKHVAAGCAASGPEHFVSLVGYNHYSIPSQAGQPSRPTVSIAGRGAASAMAREAPWPTAGWVRLSEYGSINEGWQWVGRVRKLPRAASGASAHPRRYKRA